MGWVEKTPEFEETLNFDSNFNTKFDSSNSYIRWDKFLNKSCN